MQKRDCSYTLCKGFVKELFNKYNNIKNINLEIVDILDNSIKTNININGKIKTFDIILDKKKKNVTPISKNNLKNQNTKKSNEIDNSLNIENKRNPIIILDEKEKKGDGLEVMNNVNKEDISGKFLDNTKNENYINKKRKMENNILNTKNINSECIDSTQLVENKTNINEDEYYDDYEPEDEYDINDPYFKENPEVFKCYDCYQTNIEKKELFDVAQEYIDKYNLIHEENEILKNENKKIKEMVEGDGLDIDFITNINEKFTDLIKTTHKSFNNINRILTSLETENPKKVPVLLNKNIGYYRKSMQVLADEADVIRKDYLRLNQIKFGDKIKL